MSALARNVILPSASAALQGRAEAVSIAVANRVTGNSVQGPYPAHLQQCIFDKGCFWGIEPQQKNPDGYCSRQGSDTSCVWTVPTARKFSEAHA